MEKNIIKLENVSFNYQGEININNFNLSIPKGSWLSIIGNNASGKTTLVKLIAGLIKPLSGSIIIDGLELNDENIIETRKKIGLVMQNPDNQFVATTVEDDIVFGLESLGIPKEEMGKQLRIYSEMLGISHLLKKEPSKLSGGEKQKVALAGILIMQPKIIILDEAISMLDDISKQEVLAVLEKIHKYQDVTIINVTHDMNETMYSDKVIVLHQGKIVYRGNAHHVFKYAEKLKKIDLDLPFTVELSTRLKEMGIIDKIYSNEERLVGSLWKLKSKN
jgi:energy-coupling factor transport system ATP-binding protein